MGLLNDIYEDGVKWHDIACYHTKPYVCEDSEQLLNFMRKKYPEEDIPEPPANLPISNAKPLDAPFDDLELKAEV